MKIVSQTVGRTTNAETKTPAAATFDSDFHGALHDAGMKDTAISEKALESMTLHDAGDKKKTTAHRAGTNGTPARVAEEPKAPNLVSANQPVPFAQPINRDELQQSLKDASTFQTDLRGERSTGISTTLPSPHTAGTIPTTERSSIETVDHKVGRSLPAIAEAPSQSEVSSALPIVPLPSISIPGSATIHPAEAVASKPSPTELSTSSSKEQQNTDSRTATQTDTLPDFVVQQAEATAIVEDKSLPTQTPAVQAAAAWHSAPSLGPKTNPNALGLTTDTAGASSHNSAPYSTPAVAAQKQGDAVAAVANLNRSSIPVLSSVTEAGPGSESQTQSTAPHTTNNTGAAEPVKSEPSVAPDASMPTVQQLIQAAASQSAPAAVFVQSLTEVSDRAVAPGLAVSGDQARRDITGTAPQGVPPMSLASKAKPSSVVTASDVHEKPTVGKQSDEPSVSYASTVTPLLKTTNNSEMAGHASSGSRGSVDMTSSIQVTQTGQPEWANRPVQMAASATEARTHSLPAQSPAEFQAAPGVTSAQLTQSVRSSEMKLGMQSAEFGNISINTTLNHQAISAQISIDHSELSRALAVHLPAIEEKLGSAYGVQARVELREGHHQSSPSESGYSNSGQQSREQRHYRGGGYATPQGSAFEPISGRANLPATAAIENTTRLDIRI